MKQLAILGLLAACVGPDSDGELDSLPTGKADAWGIEAPSYLAQAVVDFANATTPDELTSLGVHRRAVRAFTAATRPFASLAQLDAVGYTGHDFFTRLANHVQSNGLVGTCGDLVVQPLAAEVCDGGNCTADCRSFGNQSATFVETDHPVTALHPVGTHWVAQGGMVCYAQVFDAAGNAIDAFGEECRLIPWTGQQVISAGYRSVAFDVGTRTETHFDQPTGGTTLITQDAETSLEEENGEFLFVDRLTSQVITKAYGAVLGAEPDGALLVKGPQGYSRYRFVDDVLTGELLAPVSYATNASLSQGGLRLAKKGENKKWEIARFAPGATTPTVTTFGPFDERALYVTNDGIVLNYENAHLVLYGSDGVARRSFPCENRPTYAATLAIRETATEVVVPSDQCVIDNGIARRGFIRLPL